MVESDVFFEWFMSLDGQWQKVVRLFVQVRQAQGYSMKDACSVAYHTIRAIKGEQ